MKRSETRYKGVWSAGYDEAMREASAMLRRFVTAGGEFSADHTDAFVRGTLAMRIGDWITVAERDAEIAGMNVLLHRSAYPSAYIEPDEGADDAP